MRPYKLVRDAPPPMSWDEYKRRVTRGWKRVLASPARTDEKALQSFLEAHPSLIPGAFGWPISSGHFPFPCAVIAKPVLQGLGVKIPDFMWIAQDSGTVYPVLIEIETASKRWFKSSGTQHADLTQALDQLASWKAWFNKPENQAIFFEMYLIPQDSRLWKSLHPRYILVHGSRQEFKNKPALRAKRTELRRQDEFYVTFDSLQPSYDARDFMCVRFHSSRYEAISVPPTMQLGPSWYDRALIDRKSEAVLRNNWITPERKKFLLDRLPYWDSWATSGSGYFTLGGAE